MLFQTGEDGERLEPIEEVTIDVDDPYTGVVIEKISQRKGEMQDMRPTGAGKTRLVFLAPSRGLIGYHGEFLTDTRGTGVINRMFHGYAPHKGTVEGRRNGVLISTGDGEAVAYALWYLEERGKLFVMPGTKVYQGMIIGAERQGQRSRRQSAEGQAAHQHPHHQQGRSGAADADRAADAGAGHRLYRRRRTGRSDAAIHPPAQERIDPAPAQARKGCRGLKRTCRKITASFEDPMDRNLADKVLRSKSDRTMGQAATANGIAVAIAGTSAEPFSRVEPPDQAHGRMLMPPAQSKPRSRTRRRSAKRAAKRGQRASGLFRLDLA